MKKEITIQASPNLDTGLQQRKLLTSFTMDFRTGFFGFNWAVEQLNLKGEVVNIVGHNSEGNAQFNSHPISSPGGTFETEIPQDIKDANDAIAEILKPLFEKYGSDTPAKEEDKEVEDEA